MSSALLLSGGGDLSDPWHPFAETSAALTTLLVGAGLTVTVETGIAETITALRESRPELLVVNAGSAEAAHPLDAALIAAIGDHLAAGRPMLVMHVSATLFPAFPEWERMLGGRWVRGTTMHPDFDTTVIQVVPGSPLTAGIPDFEISDERYAFLRVDPAARPLLTHRHDGRTHPLFWTWTTGSAKVVYDALGHSAASFDSAEHRELLTRGVGWLLRD